MGSKSTIFQEEKMQTVIQNPFPVYKIASFLPLDQYERLKQQVLNDLAYFPKSTDLYSYYQSSDLKQNHRLTELNSFKEKLFSKEFIDQIVLGTQIQLNNERIDLSAFVYEKGSYLMCHDDHIGDSEDDMNGKETDARRIAFIFYLVDEDWSVEDGGALQLFACDEERKPCAITAQILPEANALVFFEVTPTSFHQVQEVFGDKKRITLTGWFHGPKSIFPSLSPTPILNPIYGQSQIQQQIQNRFLETSSVELCDFLTPEMHQRALDGLSNTFKRESFDPTRHKHLEYLLDSGTNSPLQWILSSPDFVKHLEQWTGLTLIPFQKAIKEFGQGHYTLLTQSSTVACLDVIYFLKGHNQPMPTDGGQLFYLHGSQTLLQVPPKSNTLLLVYRDVGTDRFFKYVDRRISESMICLDCVFHEKEE